MTRLRVSAFSISLDGYGAGARQSLDNPLGEHGEELHGWFIDTPTFQATHGQPVGPAGPDEPFARRSMENLGAWIMGRNMFGPVRGGWSDESWKGWWGDNPPYHCDVFVLTHHPRTSIEMDGGTVFHFVTDGIEAAWKRAKSAAHGKDVRIGGGVSTVKQYLKAGLIDEMHIAVSPVLLGAGEPFFDGVDLRALGYRLAEQTPTTKAVHHVFTR
jgi:dihydrofolate reductase